MPRRDTGDDVEYRTPLDLNKPAAKMSQDEANYDTLIAIRDYIQERLTAQSQDFNAFDVYGPEDQVIADLRYKIGIRQGIAAELQPVLDQLNSVIDKIDFKYREK